MQAVDAATGSDAAVAFQHLLANVAWVTAQAPFFHAPRRTKRHAAFGNLQIAPTAQIAPLRPLGEGVPIGPTTRHFAFGTHPRCWLLQKIAKREQDRAETHLSLRRGC